MTQTEETVYGVAPLENVARMMAMIDRIQGRAHGLPGLGCLYGRAGLGKTTASIYAVNSHQACHVEALPVGGAKSLMAMIVRELGLRPKRTTEDLWAQAAERLAQTQRPLLIDEADQILTDRSIELVRRLHDVSQAPVVLIGEEMLPQRLQRWERVASRVLCWEGMAEATLADVGHLAKIYAPGLALSDDLKAALHRASRGSIRNVSTNLAHVAEFAAVRGLKTLDMAKWGSGPFHTGEAPAPRGVPMRKGRAA